MRLKTLACAALLVLASIPHLLAQGGSLLRPGDSVDIRIANVPADDIPEFSAPYTLDESGMINVPYIGNIKAGGLAPSAVQVAIQEALVKAGIYSNPSITVTPSAGARFIVVGGAVRGPGRIQFTADLTLMSAISAAGGASDFAGDKIRLIRGGKVQFFSRRRLYKDPSKDPQVQPGDQIELIQSIW